MSLILDALSRAERDKKREAAQEPELFTSSVPEAPSDRSRLLWILIGVVLSSAAIVALLLISLLNRQAATTPEPPSTPVTPTVTPAEASASPTAESTGAIRQVAPAKPRTAHVEASIEELPEERALAAGRPPLELDNAARAEVEALYAESAADADAADGGSRTGYGESSASVAAAESVVSEPVIQDPIEPVITERTVDLASVLRDVRAASERDDAFSDHPAPPLDELSKRFRDSVPTLMYLRHDYNSSGNSRVVINGASLTKGQRTRNVLVLEILPNAVVLRFGSTDFKLRALNSWVNL